jgi:hypothetical protein
MEGATPGVAALFDGLGEGADVSVLDLGPAVAGNFEVFSRYARRMSFAGVLGSGTEAEFTRALESIPYRPDRPFDLIFAWDILDRVPPERRPALVARLAEVSVPQARLHVMVKATGPSAAHALRFSLLDVNRMRYEVDGEVADAHDPIPPSEVERLLAEDFRVVQAFSLRVGLREYVALRR